VPNPQAIQGLKRALQGSVLAPGDSTYDDVRKVWNGMIDKRPALIARCAGSADVAACVQFGRAEGLPISVRGGGHNFAGKAVIEDGLMIDLSLMKGIAVDAVARTARAQTGLKLGEFDRETQKYGLMTPLGIATTTGISGLTLGGGYGWLVGKHGLACDNVIAMQVVTAAGQIVECSDRENGDLFWGMRGAGANFGIATRIDYRLHPQTKVFGGPLFQPLTADVMRFYEEFSSRVPDELTLLGGATHGPDGKPAFATVVCYCGRPEEGARLIEPIRSFAPPLVDLIQERPYLEMQSLFDPDMVPGRRYANKAHNVRHINEGIIDTVVSCVPTMAPYPSMIGFQQLHGAAARAAADSTAYPHRYDHHVIWISPVRDAPADDAAMLRWTRDCWQAMRPFADSAVYVNALDDGAEEGEVRVREAYGKNYERLRALKRKYDPTNLFRQNSNISPD
jgi:FAD/FMN-containing dehydrogenase